ncbi:MAG: hypothetical protein FK734_19365 [Asgard group archaeon]|nr:hypothetical protein [Asgard group archaeon]
MKRKASGTKTKEIADRVAVTYDDEHWQLLTKLRTEAKALMKILAENNIKTLIYGSLTRGDVSVTSDIDIYIPYQISSFKVESLLMQENINVFGRRIVQATPKHLVKAHIELDEKTTITFPLTSMREREYDFINFGGSLTYDEILEDKRVPGVDKRLILIEPTTEGHIESPVIGYESIVAKKVGVNVELVKERVRILTTRDKVGRTGVYLNRELSTEENIDEVFKQLIDNDPIIRRRSKK